MKVVRGFVDVELCASDTVVSIGNFDGVHIGHQAVIGSAVQAAVGADLMSVVCTFDPHTRLFLDPGSPPRLLETLEQRLASIETLGVDVVVVIPFSKAVAEFPRGEFITEFLRGALGAVELHVSEDFTFGAGGAGNVEYLKRVAYENNLEVRVVSPIMADGNPVSSTCIRDAVAEGRVVDAARFLGRPFSLVGKVVGGSGRGRVLDAPTANLAVENAFVPGNGVYVTEARLDGVSYQAVTNVGVRPTFETEGKLSVETHLLDREMSLYGELLELAFLQKLRGEIEFGSADALATQIAEDVRQAANYVPIDHDDVRYTADVSSGVQARKDSGPS